MFLVLAMRVSMKKRKQSDWRFAIEQIGRELRKAYPPPENFSPFKARVRPCGALLSNMLVGCLTRRP
jgi:hypothetical protein